MSACETCGGEGTIIEFRRFAGEYMAGEPVEIPCPDCDGGWEEEIEETISTKTLAELRAEQLTDEPWSELKRTGTGGWL